MYCSAAPQELNRLVDREMPLWSIDRLRVVAHVAACAGCRDVWLRLRRQRVVTRGLSSAVSHEPLPALALAWPEAAAGESRGRLRMPSVRRVVLGTVACVAVVAAGFVLVPRPGSHVPGSAAAAVRAALAHVNTWNLSGWKLVQGRRVAWEIWGRREPFYYREQLGDQLLIDDGSRRTLHIPPDAAMGRPRGIALVVSSSRADANVTWSYSHMAEQFRPGDKPSSENGNTVTFNLNDSGIYGRGIASDNLYTVDKRTWLPTSYEVRRGRSIDPHRTTAELLRIAYDVPIPAAALGAPPVPAGYAFLDATGTRPEAVPSEYAVTRDGLTVQAAPVAADTAGSVILRVRAWLGGERLDRNGAVGFFASPVQAINAAGEPGTTIIDSPGCKDDAGRAYVSASYLPLMFGARSDEMFLLMAPLEPLKTGDQPSSALTVALCAGPTIRNRASGTVNQAEGQVLFTSTVQIIVPLTARQPSLDPDTCLGPDWQKRIRFSEPPASPAVAIEEARAGYWFGGFNWKDPSDVMTTKETRSIERQKAAIALTLEGSPTARMARGRLQQFYHFAAARHHQMGDDSRAAQMLHAILDVAAGRGGGEREWAQTARRDLQRWHLK